MSNWRSRFMLIFVCAVLGCGRHPQHTTGAVPLNHAATIAAAEEPVVNLDIWANYIAPDTIANFERETGIKVNVSTFDSDPILETQLLIGHSGYDVVTPSGPFFQRQLQAGVYQKLDKSALSNYSKLDPKILQRLAEYDPGNAYAVPYMHTTIGIAYNLDELHTRLGADIPDSWALLFDPAIGSKLKDCGIAYVDSPIQIFSAVIQYLGGNPRSMRAQDVHAASIVLHEVRPLLRYVDSSMPLADLADGRICIALTWAGDAVAARERAKDAHNGVRVVYIVPEEGGQMVIDAVGIPADAPHPRNALRWLNYLMRPKVIANLSNYLKYANGVAASLPFLTDDIKNDDSIYPDEQTQRRMINAISPTTEYSLMVNGEWTHFRSAEQPVEPRKP